VIVIAFFNNDNNTEEKWNESIKEKYDATVFKYKEDAKEATKYRYQDEFPPGNHILSILYLDVPDH